MKIPKPEAGRRGGVFGEVSSHPMQLAENCLWEPFSQNRGLSTCLRGRDPEEVARKPSLESVHLPL